MASPWHPVLLWRTFGVIVKKDLSFGSNINILSCFFFFFHLCNIPKIHSILLESDAEKLLHTFTTSTLDYCKAIPAGRPLNSIKPFSKTLRPDCRLVPLTEIISCALVLLHLLPVKFTRDFKTLWWHTKLLIAYHCLIWKILMRQITPQELFLPECWPTCGTENF